MYKYICKNSHLKSFSSLVIVPLSCDECGERMSIFESTGFTPYRYRKSNGEVQPEPETPKGFVAVQYRDEGYHGGEYWAILPFDWKMESAIALFESEGHLNCLAQVNFEDVPNEYMHNIGGV
jgi:hypothetical protein